MLYRVLNATLWVAKYRGKEQTKNIEKQMLLWALKNAVLKILNFAATVWKVTKYRVFSGPYFHVFGMGIYRWIRENTEQKNS